MYCEDGEFCDENYVEIDCNGNRITPSPPFTLAPTPPPPTPKPPTPFPPTPKPPTPNPPTFAPSPMPIQFTSSANIINCNQFVTCDQCAQNAECTFCLLSQSCVSRDNCPVNQSDDSCQTVVTSRMRAEQTKTFLDTTTTTTASSSSRLVIVWIAVGTFLVVCVLLSILVIVVMRRRRMSRLHSEANNASTTTSMHIMSKNVAYDQSATSLPLQTTPVESTFSTSQINTPVSTAHYIGIQPGNYGFQQPYSAMMPESMRPYAENGIARPGGLYVCAICRNAYPTEYDVTFHHQKRHADMGEPQIEVASYN